MIQLQLTNKMKSSQIIVVAIMLIILIAGMFILSAFGQPTVSARQINPQGLQAQVTSTPEAGDHSVVGSTDGIVVMGILIVVIIATPVLLRRRKK